MTDHTMQHLSVLSFGSNERATKKLKRLSLAKLKLLARTEGLEPGWEAIDASNKALLVEELVKVSQEYEAFITQVHRRDLSDRIRKCIGEIKQPDVFPSTRSRRKTQAHFPGAARRAKRKRSEQHATQRLFTALIPRALRAQVHIVPSGSGVCIALNGTAGNTPLLGATILTCAHCIARDGDEDAPAIDRVGRHKNIVFADGTLCVARCTCSDERTDCALLTVVHILRVGASAGVPTVVPTLALAPPDVVGLPVVCIGNPFDWDLEAEDAARVPTQLGFEPFMLSLGTIEEVEEESVRAAAASDAGAFQLGGTKHGCWTYWGHSGGALITARSEVAALHNSWDPDSPWAQRHAVSNEAVRGFLVANGHGAACRGEDGTARTRASATKAVVAINALNCLEGDSEDSDG